MESNEFLEDSKSEPKYLDLLFKAPQIIPHA